MACGFEQQVDGAPRWRHPGYDGPEPSCCAGYLVRQPDVIAVSRLKMHWNRGSAQIADARSRFLVEEMEIQTSAATAHSHRVVAEEMRKRQQERR